MKSDPVDAAIEAMERKPTAAATRAAGALTVAFGKQGDIQGIFHPPQMAQIIDRETGLPELIEACESMLEWMEFTIPRLNESNTERMNWGGPISKARNALAKAEGA